MCALAVILALYVVGFVSHGVIRHIVQTAPLWLAVWLGAKSSGWTKWVSLPPFLVWLVLMVVIWLFLLGWARLITGTFRTPEIAMTAVVGIGSIVGIFNSVRERTDISWPRAVVTFVAVLLVQLTALRVSFLPGISRDPW